MSYTGPNESDYSPNETPGSSTYGPEIPWSHLTQHKCTYCQKLCGYGWLTFISILVILLSIVWNSDSWTTPFDYYWTHQQVYYIVLIIFAWTILVIFLRFLLQYFVLPAEIPSFYSRQYKQRFPGIKHKKQERNQSTDPLLSVDISKNEEQKYDESKTKTAVSKGKIITRDKTIKRTKLEIKKRCSVMVQYFLTSRWTLYNWMSIPVVLFHIVQAVVIINSFWCHTANKDMILLCVYHITRAFTDVLPGICLILFWNAKEMYDPYSTFIKKHEKRILSKQLRPVSRTRTPSRVDHSTASTTEQNANKFKYFDNTKTLAAVHSILKKNPVKIWLLFALAFTLYIFLFWPALNADLFQQFLHCYECNHYHSGSGNHNTEDIYNGVYFVLQMCVLRPFNGMILVYAMFLTLPISKHHSSQLKGLKSLLSPAVFGLIVLFEMVELRFFHNDMVHSIMNVTMSLVYMATSVWCLTLLCSLMVLQSSAERQWNRFHAYREPNSVFVLFEGIFILICYVLLFGFILRNEQNENNTSYLLNYVREGTILAFNIVQIFMLFPLRSIGLEPGITKQYFLTPSKSKYISTFKWIVILNFITFLYSFVFITNKYSDMMSHAFDTRDNFQNAVNVVYTLSYTFTFCMPYYSIWAISQYDSWVNLDQNNLAYPESEFSIIDVHNRDEWTSNVKGMMNTHSSSADVNFIPRGKSETEMSVSSQNIGNGYNLKANLPIRSSPKTIKRNSLKKRKSRCKSEGNRPLDINAMYNGCSTPPNAMTPSVPENYNQTMGMFDPSNVPGFPEDDTYDIAPDMLENVDGSKVKDVANQT